MQQTMTILGWLLSPICAALITALIASVKRNKARDEAMERGMRALLRQQLIDYHRTYVEGGRAVPVSIKEQATSIHEAYHALGGNGTGTRLYEDIMKAPTE